MNEKQKAKELVIKFSRNPNTRSALRDIKGKRSALICCDEMLEELNDIPYVDVIGNVFLEKIKHWKGVKNEIENM